MDYIQSIKKVYKVELYFKQTNRTEVKYVLSDSVEGALAFFRKDDNLTINGATLFVDSVIISEVNTYKIDLEIQNLKKRSHRISELYQDLDNKMENNIKHSYFCGYTDASGELDTDEQEFVYEKCNKFYEDNFKKEYL